MKKLLILFVLFFSGCVSTPLLNQKSSPNPIIVERQDVEFEDIDLDEDGDISRAEVKAFNQSAKSQSPVYEQSAPIWITVGIISLTLLMCISSALIKCNKSE